MQELPICSPTIRQRDTPHLGNLKMRPSRPGPETDLVEDFVDRMNVACPRGCTYTVFVEPRLECGVPDLVIAVWHRRTYEARTNTTVDLQSLDFRVLQLLIHQEGGTTEEVSRYFPRTATDSLDRLALAGFVRRIRGSWLARSANATLALRALIAVEAKIVDWRTVLRQAWRNTWFASTSLVLFPSAPNLRGEFLPPEVGWRTPDESTIDVRLVRGPMHPRSYAVWMFNEWTWRLAFRGEESR